MKAHDGRDVVNERVQELIEALRASSAIERFRAANEGFRRDAELTALQASLRQNHELLQRAQNERRHDPRLFQEVRDMQSRLQRHPLVVEFIAARQAAQDLLRETNQEMATILGIDIGGSVGPAGGC